MMLYSWSPVQKFNESNFNLGIDLIKFIYKLYQESLSQPISIPSEMKEVDLQKVQVFEALSTFTAEHGQIIRPSVKQTIIGLGGISIKNPSIGVIAFRGTSNNQEWVEDVKALRLINLSNQTADAFSIVEKLKGVDSSSFPESLLIGDGFLNMYSTRIGVINRLNGCVCASDCKDGLCYYSPNGNYSMIGSRCYNEGMIGACNAFNRSNQSLNGQIFDFVSKMINTYKVKKFIITGHSLGGALVNLCAFHLLHAFGPSVIHSVYSYASPRTGNTEFALSLFPLYDKYFTIINSNDLVPSLPLPWPFCFSHCGRILSFAQLTADANCDTSYLLDMHDLETYRKNYNYIQ